MHELPAAERCKVSTLFADMEDNRAALFSVIEGRSPGRVLVNDLENPASVCVTVGSPPSDLYLGGDEGDPCFNEALRDLLVTEIMPRLSGGTGVAHLMLYSASEGWRRVLDGLLEEYGGRRLTRTQFTFHPERFARLRGWQERVPEGFHVKRADRELAQRIPGIAELWGSVDNFLSQGFFLCVMKGDEMISRSGTVFVGDGRAEIGVETAEPFRRQGFATLAACACIERCLEMGLHPQWGCFYNPASGRLAQKLAFEEKEGVEVYYVRIGGDG
jgi:RimJ/RimL family protein N-acetyltransferase